MRRGRHWTFGELFVEVPGNWMSDPVDVVAVGPLTLRVVRREVVLADRIVGFLHWQVTAYGAQAVALLALFGDSLDELWLRARLRQEGAEAAFDVLRTLAASTEVVDEARLQGVLERLRTRSELPGRRWMSASHELDLEMLRAGWEARRAALRALFHRIDPRGMTRPPRDLAERAWLEGRATEPPLDAPTDETASVGVFVESPTAADAARAYYARKYQR